MKQNILRSNRNYQWLENEIQALPNKGDIGNENHFRRRNVEVLQTIWHTIKRYPLLILLMFY